jgi:hypothetical protein
MFVTKDIPGTTPRGLGRKHLLHRKDLNKLTGRAVMPGCVRNAETNDLEEDGGTHEESVGSPAFLTHFIKIQFLLYVYIVNMQKKKWTPFIPQSCGE